MQFRGLSEEPLVQPELRKNSAHEFAQNRSLHKTILCNGCNENTRGLDPKRAARFFASVFVTDISVQTTFVLTLFAGCAKFFCRGDRK